MTQQVRADLGERAGVWQRVVAAVLGNWEKGREGRLQSGCIV